MTPESLSRLSRIYDEALAVADDEREAWLGRLSGDDAALAPQLRAMLAGTGQETGDLLAHGQAFAVPEDGATFVAGATVGPYKLLRQLGEGGMGEVWLAERHDGQLRRAVALKLPTLGLRRSVLVQRFARERDILASLEHPNIARLYDAGLADDGQPYLALEYVEGRPITDYCDAERCDLRARVRLMRQVAQAVQYAHANLVVHRDLKPGNVLVRADGTAVLLDFGIAKLVEAERGEAAETELTQIGGRALTLAYAAPEQITGAPVRTATDVYALGVLLYELVAGSRPFVGTRQEIEQAVLTREPAPPRGAPAALVTIVLKALQKAPDDRYASADALAQDLGRWLAGERVLAQPDSAGRRLSRLVRRHRVALTAAATVSLAYVLAIGLGAAAVVIAALAVALAFALWLTRRATLERDRALALAARNAAVNAFLDTLFTGAAGGGALTSEQLLDRSERLVEREVQGQPEHRAYVLSVLAGCWSGIGQLGRAERLLARALEVARDVADGGLRATLQAAHGIAAGQLGRVDEAIAAVDAQLLRAGTEAEARARLHRARSVLASLQGDSAGTLHHASEALRFYRAAPALPRQDEATFLADLGWAQLMAGHIDEADRCYAEALRRLQALGLAESVRALIVLSNWAHAVQEMGELPRALELFDRAQQVATSIAPDTPPTPFVVANRAYVLARIGRPDEAALAYRRCAEHTETQGEAMLTYSIRMCLVQLLAEQGRVDEARAALADAEARCALPVPEGGAGGYMRRLALGWIALGEGDGAAASERFAGLVEEDSAGTVDALLGRVAALERLDRLDEAAADATRALAIARRWQRRQASSFRSGLALLALARVLRRQQRDPEARAAAREALPQLQATLERRHPAIAEAQALS